ncbi:hypothetical protein C8J57DRAFT_1637236 [Mycena rebaudengoi]|nr:hypothetical protein C8J57DRAFT_1637236 [Mycena rebaudengoi]
MNDPPKTPPPFRRRVLKDPITPVSPFKFDPDLSKAIPAGNFLILRGVHTRGDRKIDPVPTVAAKLVELRQDIPTLNNIPVDIVPFSTRDVSTSCYLKLAASLTSPDPKAEPRTDLLTIWSDAIIACTAWEVAWAPQVEGKDKRMWLRVNDVFEKDLVRSDTEQKKSDDKVITTFRDAFERENYQTVNAFRSGSGIIFTFAFPYDVDKAAHGRYISVGTATYPVHRVRQIEIDFAFELVVGGMAGIDPSAKQNICGWFAAFEQYGQSLLLDTRTPLGENDFLVIAMADWAATAAVLKSTERFTKELADYNLRPPQLLFTLNSTAAWKISTSSTITEGAEKVSSTIAALTRRVEATDRDARARDAEMKDPSRRHGPGLLAAAAGNPALVVADAHRHRHHDGPQHLCLPPRRR